MVIHEKVRCKFKCETVSFDVNGAQVKLSPVTHGSGDNDSFFKYTPYGSIEFGTINVEAASLFTPGEEYYVDFTRA